MTLRYQLALLLVLIGVWIFAAISPLDRGTWLLENILVIVAVPAVFLLAKYLKFSKLTLALFTMFITLHLIGSHWGYADVPFGWTLGEWVGSERNMYDRLVHFAFGLLVAYPIRELFTRITEIRNIWSYIIPLDIVLSLSALFEIVEWIASSSVNGPVGVAFLGAQGDAWDTQKDMGAAALGALIAILIILAVKRRWRAVEAQ